MVCYFWQVATNEKHSAEQTMLLVHCNVTFVKKKVRFFLFNTPLIETRSIRSVHIFPPQYQPVNKAVFTESTVTVKDIKPCNKLNIISLCLQRNKQTKKPTTTIQPPQSEGPIHSPVCVLMCPWSSHGLEKAFPHILQTQGKV